MWSSDLIKPNMITFLDIYKENAEPDYHRECHQKSFLALHCDQTVGLFQLFSTVLKRFCPVQSKNTFILVLAIFFIFEKTLTLQDKISSQQLRKLEKVKPFGYSEALKNAAFCSFSRSWGK